MKPSPRAGCGCLLAVVLCLCAIVSLTLLRPRFFPPRPAPAPTPDEAPPPRLPQPTPRPTPTPEPERYLERVPTRGVFNREDQGGRYRLAFGFIDHHGRSHDVLCAVDKRDYVREQAWFGYEQRQLDALLDDALARRVAEELESRGLAPHVTIRSERGGAYRWSSQFQDVADGTELSRLMLAREEWMQWMKAGFEAERQRIEASLYKARGFLLEGRRLEIDYAQIAVRATPPLLDCFRSLTAAAVGSNERQRLGLFLAFFQELSYQVPPDKIGHREIQGLWVPTEVLVDGRGDCDSKSAAFCALWRNLKPRVVLITVPGHALVAVEGKPGPQEHFIRLGNRYYVLCEIAGPAKRHPGLKPLSGHFRYVTIPAVRERAGAGL